MKKKLLASLLAAGLVVPTGTTFAFNLESLQDIANDPRPLAEQLDGLTTVENTAPTAEENEAAKKEAEKKALIFLAADEARLQGKVSDETRAKLAEYGVNVDDLKLFEPKADEVVASNEAVKDAVKDAVNTPAKAGAKKLPKTSAAK